MIGEEGFASSDASLDACGVESVDPIRCRMLTICQDCAKVGSTSGHHDMSPVNAGQDCMPSGHGYSNCSCLDICVVVAERGILSLNHGRATLRV